MDNGVSTTIVPTTGTTWSGTTTGTSPNKRGATEPTIDETRSATLATSGQKDRRAD